MQAFGDHVNVTAYAFCYLQSKWGKDTTISLGSDDGAAVWFNGKLVHKNSNRNTFTLDKNVFPVQVEEGKNRLLVKITQVGRDWGLACRISLTVGGQLLMLDGETPHQNAVVQVLKDSRVFDTVLSDRTGRSKPRHLQFTPISKRGNTFQLESKTKVT